MEYWLSDLSSAEIQVIHQWSKDKLDLLAKYLHSYTTIMKKKHEDKGWPTYYLYVDAFAGPVIYRETDPDEQAYVSDSPVQALNTNPPFSKYIFIEINQKRIEWLERLKLSFPGKAIEVLQGDANLLLNTLALRVRRDRAHGLVFLDPYGLEVDFKTVALLAKGAFDVFINFSIMGVTRALLPATGYPSQQQCKEINRVMGSAISLEKLYTGQCTLFGDIEYTRGVLPAEKLAGLYAEGLCKVFKYVSKPVIMRNSRGGPLYALYLASNNQTAIKITNDIFGHYEKLKAAGN
ncbi:MAG: three-Cys-motif partner protein TcmP [Bacillota bacterium]